MTKKQADGGKRSPRKKRAPDIWDVPIKLQCHAKQAAGVVCRKRGTQKDGRCQDHEGKPRVCGARTRTPLPDGGQGYCTQTQLLIGQRCKLHGGKSPTGPDSKPYTTGRWSKYLPEGIIQRFQEALADPQLMQIRQDMALLDALVTARTDRLKARKGPQNLTERDERRIAHLVDQRRRLADSEARRMAAMQQNVTLVQFIGVMRVVADLIREFVPDDDQRRLAQARLQKLLLARSDGPVQDGEVVERRGGSGS